jgi:hypothetical protein
VAIAIGSIFAIESHPRYRFAQLHPTTPLRGYKAPLFSCYRSGTFVMAGKAVNKIYYSRNYGATEATTPGDTDYAPGDMLKSVTNGIGIKSQWHYRPLSSKQNPDFYQTDFTDVIDGVVDDEHFHFASSMYALTEFKQSNGPPTSTVVPCTTPKAGGSEGLNPSSKPTTPIWVW